MHVTRPVLWATCIAAGTGAGTVGVTIAINAELDNAPSKFLAKSLGDVPNGNSGWLAWTAQFSTLIVVVVIWLSVCAFAVPPPEPTEGLLGQQPD
jgi:hypothetical protein